MRTGQSQVDGEADVELARAAAFPSIWRVPKIKV